MILFAETFRENVRTNNGDQGLFFKKVDEKLCVEKYRDVF